LTVATKRFAPSEPTPGRGDGVPRTGAGEKNDE
jgi:hypothetical protein